MRKLYIFEKDREIEKRSLDLDIPLEKGAFDVWRIWGWKLKEIKLLNQDQNFHTNKKLR